MLGAMTHNEYSEYFLHAMYIEIINKTPFFLIYFTRYFMKYKFQTNVSIHYVRETGNDSK